MKEKIVYTAIDEILKEHNINAFRENHAVPEIDGILTGINEPSHPHTSLHNITRPESLSGHR